MRMDFSETVSGDIDGTVLVVTINNPPVNALSANVRLGLSVAFGFFAKEPDLTSAVLTGAGKTFIGGADISEFGKPMAEPILPDLLLTIESCEKPVVAAINGAALGGGLETAMACHARVLSKEAKIGLPEVKLGLVPGAGGTQRLPRLVGLEAAIDMIATGKTVTSAEAAKSGLVDAVSTGNVLEDARALARSLAGKPVTRARDKAVAPVSPDSLEAVSAKIIAKARGQQAPREAIRLITLASTLPFADGMAEERKTFLTLRDSLESQALRHVFFAERASAKIDRIDGIEPRPAKTIGVIGLGLMGSGIVAASLSAGYRVIGIDMSEEAASAGRARVHGLIDKALSQGRLTEAAAELQKQNFTATHLLEDLGDCDLVIEAVFDDLAVKTRLFETLDPILSDDAILATNTSYLNPDDLAKAIRNPERVLGLHFFSPAHIMRLVEVVQCAATSPEVLATGFAVARKLGKLPILSGVTEGFIGNRMFSALRREAEFLLEDGALPQDIDSTLEEFGYAMGPFAVFDLAGLEIAWARRKRLAASRDPAERYVVIADRLCEMGRFGQKSGAGWYSYAGGKKAVDPLVTGLIEAARAEKGLVAATLSPAEILSRLLAALRTEGEKLLAEKIALRASDIDLVMINGYGFPAHRGGPMFWTAQQSAL